MCQKTTENFSLYTSALISCVTSEDVIFCGEKENTEVCKRLTSKYYKKSAKLTNRKSIDQPICSRHERHPCRACPLFYKIVGPLRVSFICQSAKTFSIKAKWRRSIVLQDFVSVLMMMNGFLTLTSKLIVQKLDTENVELNHTADAWLNADDNRKRFWTLKIASSSARSKSLATLSIWTWFFHADEQHLIYCQGSISF